MAQMSVPAEPSYKTTSYNGLKGADFSNDPSLVARNHSPDLLNMISDNGGSPIKRKGWEVTTEIGDEVIRIWHFQMFEKLWHIVACRDENSPSQIDLYEFDNDGALVSVAISLNCSTTPCGYFFNSADESKTGFYILHEKGIEFVRPVDANANSLTFTAVTPTIPIVRSLSKPNGTEGIMLYPVNLLTNKRTYRFWNNGSGKVYTIGHTISNAAGATTAKFLDSNGEWQTTTVSSVNTNGTVTLSSTPTITPADPTDNVEITVTSTVSGAVNTKIPECTCATIYSQMTEGQVFVSGNPKFPQYVWYSELSDPCYFPDVNYLFVGGAGTGVKGMMPYNSQIAVFKEPSVTESTIFMLTYNTATDQKTDANGETYTETRDTYQVKHGFAGIGSLSADTTLSLGDEPLFLSQNGIMGMVSNAINSSNSVKNRSGYLDPRLLDETDLSKAIATVHKNYYILVLNGHAYVLDARQKNADYKGNTSYLYESYYWDNIPATAIASDSTTLWFGTADGRLCRFKNSDRMSDYSDGTHYGDEPIRVYVKRGETALSSTWFVNSGNEAITPDEDEKYTIMGEVYVDDGEIIVDPEYNDGTYQKYDVFSYTGSVYQSEYTVAPIYAVWSTPLDNDGATNYFKTLQKKGSGCTLYPFYRSSVDAYLQKDINAEVYIGSMTIDIDNWEDTDFTRFSFIASKAPRDMFFRKKMKKYKRLKIILKNNQLDEGFGVQEIFKTYLFARYAK